MKNMKVGGKIDPLRPPPLEKTTLNKPSLIRVNWYKIALILGYLADP